MPSPTCGYDRSHLSLPFAYVPDKTAPTQSDWNRIQSDYPGRPGKRRLGTFHFQRGQSVGLAVSEGLHPMHLEQIVEREGSGQGTRQPPLSHSSRSISSCYLTIGVSGKPSLSPIVLDPNLQSTCQIPNMFFTPNKCQVCLPLPSKGITRSSSFCFGDSETSTEIVHNHSKH